MTGNRTRWMGTQPGVINLMPLLPLLPTNGKPLQIWSIMHELVSYLIGLLFHEERPSNQLNTSLLFLDKKRETKNFFASHFSFSEFAYRPQPVPCHLSYPRPGKAAEISGKGKKCGPLDLSLGETFFQRALLSVKPRNSEAY